MTARRFNEVVRSHWGVENRLHWRLDVVMNEDQDRNRMDNSPILPYSIFDRLTDWWKRRI